MRLDVAVSGSENGPSSFLSSRKKPQEWCAGFAAISVDIGILFEMRASDA